MILREATKADLKPLMALCKRAWTQTSIHHDTNIDIFHNLYRQGRIVVLWEGKALVAGVGAIYVDAADGPGVEVVLFVVDQGHPDRLRLLDAVSLFAMNLARSEGVRVVLSRRRKELATIRYGLDLLGMGRLGPERAEAEVRQVGDIGDMMRHILERHPEWLTSL